MIELGEAKDVNQSLLPNEFFNEDVMECWKYYLALQVSFGKLCSTRPIFRKLDNDEDEEGLKTLSMNNREWAKDFLLQYEYLLSNFEDELKYLSGIGAIDFGKVYFRRYRAVCKFLRKKPKKKFSKFEKYFGYDYSEEYPEQ